jgi:hypothetical protein
MAMNERSCRGSVGVYSDALNVECPCSMFVSVFRVWGRMSNVRRLSNRSLNCLAVSGVLLGFWGRIRQEEGGRKKGKKERKKEKREKGEKRRKKIIIPVRPDSVLKLPRLQLSEE